MIRPPSLLRSFGETGLAVAIALIVLGGAVPVRAQSTSLPPVGPERPFAPAARVERTLANGLRVTALRHATVPKVTAILAIQSGLAVEPADKAGLAQFVVDLAQEGTTTRSSEQIKREVFGLGASLTGIAGQDVSTFQVRGLNNTLPQMLAIMADVVRNPNFPQGELDLMKANTAQRLQAQTASPQYVNNKLFRQTLFGTHPYARIGVTPDTLPAIDRQSIVGFQQTYYRPNNADLIVVGDVAADAVFAAAEQAFGTWERRALPEAKPAAMPALKGRTLVFVQRPNSVQSSISVGNITPERDDPRWYTLQLANQIFGAAFDSRLVRNIREEKGYTYSPQSIFQSMGQGGLYRAVADVRNDVTGATLKEIYAEIDKMRERRSGNRGVERRQAVFARSVRAAERFADRPGQHAQHDGDLQAAEGLPRNVPAADFAAIGRSGEDRRADAPGCGGFRRRDRG